MSVPALSSELAEELQTQSGYGGLLDGIGEILRNAASADNRPAPLIHGDFWAMNVLFSDRLVSVIDWDHFGPGFPLEDLFSFVVYQEYVTQNRYCTTPEAYAHCFFSDSPVCRFVSRQVANGFSPDQGRLYFYGFVGRKICRGTTPVNEWRALLERLAAAGYPAPCTRII